MCFGQTTFFFSVLFYFSYFRLLEVGTCILRAPVATPLIWQELAQHKMRQALLRGNRAYRCVHCRSDNYLTRVVFPANFLNILSLVVNLRDK